MSIESAPVPRLDNVQALRGIAAIMVVFYHIALFLREGVFPGISGFPSGIWDRGWVGVDLFFVISGFIMVWTTRRAATGLRSAGTFLWRRAVRIYPLWWVCAGIMALYFSVTYGMPAAPDRVSGQAEAWGFAVKSFALWPQSVPPMLGVGWTLIHEMWFYLVFAGAILLPRKCLIWILLAWAALTLGLYFGIGPMHSRDPVRFVMLSPLNLEFIAGALAALLIIRSPSLSAKTSWPHLIIGLSAVWLIGAMGLAAVIPNQSQHFSRVVIYALPITGLIWGSSRLALAGRLQTPRALVWLGDVSYSLYLTHYIVMIVVRRLLRSLDVSGFNPTFISAAMIVILLSLSLVTAWVTYRVIERPLIAFFKRRRGRLPAQTPG